MRLALDVAQRAGSAVYLAMTAERRRAVTLGLLNIAAATLAIGALHIGGAIVSGEPTQTISEPSPQAAAFAPVPHPAPVPRLEPVHLVAVPDAATLFAQPVAEPGSFTTDFRGGASNAFTPAVAPEAEVPPPPAAPGAANTVSAAVPSVARALRRQQTEVVLAEAGPLMLSDAMLDATAGASVSVAQGVSAGIAGAASVGSAVGSAAASASSTVSGVASSAVSGVASSAVSGVASSVGGVASSVGSAVGGVASAAR